MVTISNMIMIGSGGRNAGKTFAAMELVRRFKTEAAKNSPIRLIGLKVTGVEKSNGVCPRGGKGCGACAINGDFCLSEEKNNACDKDTSLLLAAGADKVFWLRCLRASFESGIAAFLKEIDPAGNGKGHDKTIIICESNSLRNSVLPGLFVMIKNNETPKPSAASVADLADLSLQNPVSKDDLDLLYALARQRCI
ncbi:hypothetical protein FACS1894190_13120 [Spirochaetia bacterium]|nr:hypothetical protein FACS1894190_13120 [Spirochaetia bacterium]